MKWLYWCFRIYKWLYEVKLLLKCKRYGTIYLCISVSCARELFVWPWILSQNIIMKFLISTFCIEAQFSSRKQKYEVHTISSLSNLVWRVTSFVGTLLPTIDVIRHPTFIPFNIFDQFYIFIICWSTKIKDTWLILFLNLI